MRGGGNRDEVVCQLWCVENPLHFSYVVFCVIPEFRLPITLTSNKVYWFGKCNIMIMRDGNKYKNEISICQLMKNGFRYGLNGNISFFSSLEFRILSFCLTEIKIYLCALFSQNHWMNWLLVNASVCYTQCVSKWTVLYYQ